MFEEGEEGAKSLVICVTGWTLSTLEGGGGGGGGGGGVSRGELPIPPL